MPQLIANDPKIRRIHHDQLVFRSSSPAFGTGTLELLVLNIIPGARVDVIDAYACLWTAQRITANKAISFPEDAVRGFEDGNGRVGGGNDSAL